MRLQHGEPRGSAHQGKPLCFSQGFSVSVAISPKNRNYGKFQGASGTETRLYYRLEDPGEDHYKRGVAMS